MGITKTISVAKAKDSSIDKALKDCIISFDIVRLRETDSHPSIRNQLLRQSQDWPLLIIDLSSIAAISSSQIAWLLSIGKETKTALIVQEGVFFVLKAIHAHTILIVERNLEDLKKEERVQFVYRRERLESLEQAEVNVTAQTL